MMQPRNTKCSNLYLGHDKADKVGRDLHDKGSRGYMNLGDFAYSPIALLLAPNELQNTKRSEQSCNKEIHLTPRNFPIYLNRECFFDIAVTNHPTTLYFMKHPWGAIWDSKASEREMLRFSLLRKNSSTILDGFKRNKTGWNEGDQLGEEEIET